MHIISALDAAKNLLIVNRTRDESIAYALYKLEYKHDKKIRVLTLTSQQDGLDFRETFTPIINDSTLDELSGRHNVQMSLPPSDPLFWQFVHHNTFGKSDLPAREALLLVPLLTFRQSLKYPSVELVFCLLAPNQDDFVTDISILNSVGTMLGAALKPVFNRHRSEGVFSSTNATTKKILDPNLPGK